MKWHQHQPSQLGLSTVSVKTFIGIASTFRQTLSIRLNTDTPLNVCKEIDSRLKPTVKHSCSFALLWKFSPPWNPPAPIIFSFPGMGSIWWKEKMAEKSNVCLLLHLGFYRASLQFAFQFCSSNVTYKMSKYLNYRRKIGYATLWVKKKSCLSFYRAF